MKTASIFIGLLLAGGVIDVVAQEEGDAEGMKPVKPQLLWEAMPRQLEEWKMLKSTGEMGLGTWLESRAVREYERKELPPKPGQTGTTPAPKMWTRILITDTGKHPEPLAEFQNFSTETPAEDTRIERIRIQTWPTIARTYEDGLIVANMMVAERFLVELVLKNQPKRNLRNWCRQLDLKVLAKVPDSEVIPLPPEVLMVKLDQMKPKKNKGYLMGTTSEADLDRELAAEETELREVMGYVPEIEEEEAVPLSSPAGEVP